MNRRRIAVAAAVALLMRIPTGSKNLDDLLLGGIETHAITEFYGSAGAGKSQICYTLAVMAAQNKENGKNGRVIYVDTEGKFRPERLVTIARSRESRIRPEYFDFV